MTNKEAAEILTAIKNTPGVTWTNGADTAFDLAIKALEEDRYAEGYSDGYLDGYSGADWKTYTPDSFTSSVQRWRQKNELR